MIKTWNSGVMWISAATGNEKILTRMDFKSRQALLPRYPNITLKTMSLVYCHIFGSYFFPYDSNWWCTGFVVAPVESKM